MTAVAPLGYVGSDWDEWLEAVSEDVRGEAGPAVATYIREPYNAVRWMRALSALDSDVNARMADARLRLEAARPEPGSPDSRAWYDARRESKNLHASRVRFRQAVHERLIECRALLASLRLDERLTAESLLQVIARAAALLDRDDPEAAEGLLAATLKQAQEADLTPG
jgi:hypothetical protein